MNAPRRLLAKNTGATPPERELLATRGGFDPDPGDERRVWTALAARLELPSDGDGGASPPPAPPAPPAAPSAGGGLASLLGRVGAKHLAAALPLGLALGGAFWLARRAPVDTVDRGVPTPVDVAPPPSAPDPGVAPLADAPLSPPAPATPPRADGIDATTSARPVAKPAADEAHADVSLSPASRLREESLMLARAQTQLRAGNPAGALELVRQARERFPRSRLGQEREALTIEALYRAGQGAAAAARASSFLRTYPNSPHAERVRTFAGAPDGR